MAALDKKEQTLKVNTMRRPIWLCLLLLPFTAASVRLPAQAPKQADASVYATIETTLATNAKQIRMFAMDGDPNTYFASARNPTANDHFTLVLDKAVVLTSIAVTTGQPDGRNKLEAGVLEISEDGKEFETLAKIVDGKANVKAGSSAIKGKRLEVKAIRLRPTQDMQHPLAIREIVVHSSPAVAVFKYPVEYTLDVADAPEMKEWGEKVVKICERAYQWIADELQSPGYKPPTVVNMALKKDYKGVAAASGTNITGSVDFFKRNPKDMGAMVHETVHIIQQYRGAPKGTGWLTEGIADYIRFFKYEPEKIGKLNIATAKYDGSYRVTARFLAYVSDKYDKELVRKLNRALREKAYNEEIWKSLTGSTLQELGNDWLVALKSGDKKTFHVEYDDPQNSLDKPLVLEIWPGKVPDEPGGIGPEKVVMSQKLTRKQGEVTESTRMVTNVTKPTIAVYRPAKDKDTGTAIVICPGGGYWNLYWELEGEEVAAWLNSLGITGIILKYRVPRRPGEPQAEPARRPLQDAQRAVSLIRTKAKEWGIAPDRIGMVGFSAGGHLAIATATSFEKRSYEAIDDIDTTSCRPDFAILVYPGYLKPKDKDTLSPGLSIPKGTPPVFLVHGSDDIISPPDHSAVMYMALQRAGVPAELHIYEKSTHDFGVRRNESPCSAWTQACADWLRQESLIKR
jgi:acetyl esterase/lipase